MVLELTHRSGHIIDWLVARESDNLVPSVSVTDQLESDHKAFLACLNLSKPLRNSRLVISRELKTTNKNKFGSDAAAQRLTFIPSSSDPASHYKFLDKIVDLPKRLSRQKLYLWQLPLMMVDEVGTTRARRSVSSHVANDIHTSLFLASSSTGHSIVPLSCGAVLSQCGTSVLH